MALYAISRSIMAKCSVTDELSIIERPRTASCYLIIFRECKKKGRRLELWLAFTIYCTGIVATIWVIAFIILEWSAPGSVVM